MQPDGVRNLWINRLRHGASVPKYLIVELSLDEVFEFTPDPNTKNGDFYFSLREKPDGPPKTAA